MTTRRFRVGKLIRDGLPAIMRAQGLSVFEHRMDDAAFRSALRDKLLEEAQEAVTASADDLVEELADLLEVIRSLAEVEGFDMAAVETRRLVKRAERGGFEGRVFNAAVEGPADLPALTYYVQRPEAYPEED